MQTLLNTGGRLAVIAALAALILALVNAVTAPVIEENRRERLNRTLSAIVGDQAVGERQDVTGYEVVQGYYPVAGGDAYVLDLLGEGYGGEIRILAGYRRDGELFAARLMENSETPGLGKQAEEPGYMTKYTGHGDDEPIPTRPDQLPREQADSVSGATITFAGIGQALAAGADFVVSVEGL